jgi:ABC-2 type transport system permease protein
MLNKYMGFWTVLRREIYRFWSIKRQTILGPLLETYLYISIFGAALGSRIQHIDGVSYTVFIIPGLLLMSMAINAFSNNSSSLLQQKFQRSIDDQLSSPVSNGALMAAFTLGGFFRGSIIAATTFITASFLIDIPIAHPALLVSSLAICGLFFGSIGVFVGLRSETFDNLSFYQTFIITPLIFLGGIFYSVNLLKEPFRAITHLDPIFYMINTVRFGIIGHSDTNPYAALTVIAAATVAMLVLNYRLFQKGYRLRT